MENEMKHAIARYSILLIDNIWQGKNSRYYVQQIWVIQRMLLHCPLLIHLNPFFPVLFSPRSSPLILFLLLVFTLFHFCTNLHIPPPFLPSLNLPLLVPKRDFKAIAKRSRRDCKAIG
jgi:hypothetical protein